MLRQCHVVFCAVGMHVQASQGRCQVHTQERLWRLETTLLLGLLLLQGVDSLPADTPVKVILLCCSSATASWRQCSSWLSAQHR
jgi:hypothetical protein